jgi:broad specificity phosphatase PhoE
MIRILLARHGETEWNALGMLQGHTDVPLNDIGREQARSLIATVSLAGVASVWSSDLARAQETAAIVATALAVAAPSIDPELRERRFGVFEGLTREQCAGRYPREWQAWRTETAPPPGAESSEVVVARMTRALERIAGQSQGSVLVVSHGGAMRLWLMQVLGEDVPLIDNGAIFVVEHDRGGFRVLR